MTLDAAVSIQMERCFEAVLSPDEYDEATVKMLADRVVKRMRVMALETNATLEEIIRAAFEFVLENYRAKNPRNGL